MSLKVIILVDRGSSSEERKPGALTAFPYDRITVECFGEAFPRARWSDDKRLGLCRAKLLRVVWTVGWRARLIKCSRTPTLKAGTRLSLSLSPAHIWSG